MAFIREHPTLRVAQVTGRKDALYHGLGKTPIVYLADAHARKVCFERDTGLHVLVMQAILKKIFHRNFQSTQVL